MSDETGPSENRTGPGAPEASLPEAVRSAILDRLLEDLSSDDTPWRSRSRYTKSDSGLYGKYEKYEALDAGYVGDIIAALEGIADRIAPFDGTPPEPAGPAS